MRSNRTTLRLAVMLAITMLTLRADVAASQDQLPMPDHRESHHYDFWPGTWVEVAEDPIQRVFRVRSTVHRAAFLEEWLSIRGTDTTLDATALRAWDKTLEKWMYTWVSGNGLYQAWDGIKVGEHWYITRPFIIAGERVLSRQAWIPEGEDRIVRVSDHSRDEGKSWHRRFRIVYRRVAE